MKTLYSATSRKGRESDTQKSKAAVDRARWEQQSCRGAAQETAVHLKAIIVRLMDGVGSYRKSAISQIARFDVNFYKIYKSAVTYHISWVFNITKTAIDFGT